MSEAEDTRTPEQKAEEEAVVKDLLDQVAELGAEKRRQEGWSEPPPYKPPVRKPESYIASGTISEQVEMQIAMLTQGVMESMMLSSGEFRVEPPPEQENVWQRRSASKAALSRAQMARSADLKDAARLTEASAKLLTGFARLRGQFKQDFTVHHTSSRDDKTGERKHVTVARQNFTTPRVDPKDANAALDAAKGALTAAEMALEALIETKKANCAKEKAA